MFWITCILQVTVEIADGLPHYGDIISSPGLAIGKVMSWSARQSLVEKCFIHRELI